MDPHQWHDWASEPTICCRRQAASSAWRLLLQARELLLLCPWHLNCAEKLLQQNSDSVSAAVVGRLLVIHAVAANRLQLDFNTRLQSFLSVLDSAAACRWAQSGFYSIGGDGASCCYCQCRVPADRLIADDPERWHISQKPDCQLLRLLQLLDKRLSAKVADSLRFESLFRQVEDAINNQSVLLAESFGFSKFDLTLAAAAHVFQATADAELRSGELIQLVKQANATVGSAASCRWLKFIDANTSTKNHPVEDRQPTAQSAETSPASGRRVSELSSFSQPDLSSSDSPLCQRCFTRNRDRVILPCAHFCFCSRCLTAEVRSCPKCRADILTVIRATIC
ncbi:hypothetical protein BOX15_Mlig014265g1 [Macrostomum lignano]|uniref:RING-type domain-containing protein n=1 Tax=Macrostomum lignano TaxID=282301 RepID=A0A267DSF8_9PLAT|nr:hypothetical protein BOX15_Mlig014265g1 [Macrostomum lignano]